MNKFIIFLESIEENNPSLINAIKSAYQLIEGEATDKAVEIANSNIDAESPQDIIEPIEQPIEQPLVSIEDEPIAPTDVTSMPEQPIDEPSVNLDVNDTTESSIETPVISDVDVEESGEILEESSGYDASYEEEIFRQMGKDNLATLFKEAVTRQKESDPSYVPMLISRAKSYIAEPNLMGEHALSSFLQKRISSL